jgi:uncharacterized membrane protein/protein-disulfide isomerase
MNYLSSLLLPLGHCEDAVFFLLKQLDIKCVKSNLKEKLLAHSNYPSLLAVGDVLTFYGVKSLSVLLAHEDWKESLDLPFIAGIKTNNLEHTVFCVVTAFSETEVEFYDPESKRVKRLANDDFDKKYKGVVLAIDAEEVREDPDYKKNQSKENQKFYFSLFALLFIPVITLISCGYLLSFDHSANGIYRSVFTLFSLLGVLTSALIIWHDIDNYNPVVKKFCGAGDKVDCDNILKSAASKIFGVSWGEIGLSYFLAVLLFLIFGGLYSAEKFSVLGLITVLALPYTVFSVFFQWRIAKKWCTLCITIQVLLLTQFLLLLLYNNQVFSALPGTSFNYLVLSFVFILLVVGVHLIVRGFDTQKEYWVQSIRLQRTKHDQQIFYPLLEKQRAVEAPSNEIGIFLGNQAGKYKLIKICNPYCAPCAKSHPEIEALVENYNEVGVQIIFTATDDEGDPARLPVLHLLALAAKGDVHRLQTALDDWYNSPDKDYNAFSKAYPVEDNIENYRPIVRQMYEWCASIGVAVTPTFFVNGRELPQLFTIPDLNYILLD